MSTLFQRIYLSVCVACFSLLTLATSRAADTLAVGNGFSGQISTSGVLSTWGKNDSGQLGHSASTTPVSTPTLVPGSWSKVAMGDSFTLALDSSGKLYAWGNNTQSQLGSGSQLTISVTPVLVALPAGISVVDFTAGYQHAVMLGSDGQIYTWGYNGLGQLGTGDTTNRSTPTKVVFKGLDKKKKPIVLNMSFSSIATTDNSTFAIATDGSLWAWGSNSSGELGTTSKSFINSSPAMVGKSKGWSGLSTGSRHVIGVLGGKVYVWGDNSMGQLGTGKQGGALNKPTALKFKMPKKVKVPALVRYVAGGMQTFGLTADGTLYGWGSNQMGQLGITSGNVLLSPTLVSATERYSQVESSAFSTLLTTSSTSSTPSSLFAVGSNINGELGNGLVENTRGTGVTTTPKVNVPNLAVAAPAVVSEIKSADGLNSFGLGGTFGPLALVVQNKGTAAHTAAYTVSYYLSTDATLDASDRLLVSRTETTALGAGETRGTQFSASDLTIPQLVPGIYYLLSQVTSSNQSDGFAPDNGASIQLELTTFDLAVSATDTRIVPTSTNTLPSFSTLLRNIGQAPIAAGTSIGYRIFLSSDATLSADDIDLTGGRDATYLVQSGDFVYNKVFVPVTHSGYSLPSNLPAGTYSVFVVYNRNATLSESNLGNNTVTFTVPTSLADLAVSAPIASASSVGSNSTITSVSTFVQNRSTYNYSSTYQVSLYLSADAQFSTDDIVIASTTESSAILASGSRQVFFSNVQIPDVASGSYSLIARVQVASTESDGNLLNNFSSSDLTVGDPALVVDSFTFPNTTSIDKGGSLGTVAYRLRNTGTGSVASGRNVLMQVWLSTNATLEEGADVLIDQYSYTGGLSSGASVIIPETPHTLALPTSLNNGVYNLLFVPTLIGTGNKEDLKFDGSVQVISVGVLDVGVSAPVLQGTTPVTLGVNSTLPNTTVTINNNGGFDVPTGCVVKLWLSVNDSVDTSDVLIGSTTLNTTIAAQGSRGVNFSGITVPNIGKGPYYLISELILPSGLLDTKQDDNYGSTPVNLERPSLEIKNISGVSNELNLDTTNVINSVSFDLFNESQALIANTEAISYEVYLSRDNQISASSDTLLHSGSWTTGLAAGATGSVTPFNLTIPANTVGGNYYLIFVANQNGSVVLGTDIQAPQLVRQIILKKVDAPGAALDYGTVSFNGTWLTVTDNAASNAEALQSPTLALGQTASVSMDVYGPAVVRIPWKVISAPMIISPTVTGALDEISYATLPAGTASTLTAAASSDAYRMPDDKPIFVSAEGKTTITWTYSQKSSYLNGYARLDFDLPNYITSGDGSWTGIADATAKEGSTIAKSPSLASGQQASLELTVNGPALVKFWWKSNSTANQDVLGFYVDGVLAQLPTTDYTSAAVPAKISGTQGWQQVAFLIGDGPRTLRWTYEQGSANTSSVAYLDKLEVLSVLDSDNQTRAPSTNTLNRTNDSADGEMQNIPESNVDLAISSVTSTPGTYLLDDANGTSRLPLTVLINSVGYDFSANPSWSASNMQVRLSTNATYGDADDIILGDYQQFSSIPHNRQLTLNAEINLPFNIPGGNYYLFVRVMGASGVTEFTYANNTYGAGNGYIIKRAPNLVVDDYSGLAPQFPYHPEDSVYISYALKNTGLGTVLPTQPFKVRLSLMARDPEETDISKGKLIKEYPLNSYSLFLPEIGGQYPSGGSYDVVQSLSLPSTRDILAQLGSINATDPEDSAPVYAKLGDLRKFIYYFKIFVDVENAIAESSETNVFWFGDSFYIVPTSPYDGVSQSTTYTTTFGQFIGDAAFGSFFVGDPALNGTDTSDKRFAARVRDYALYRAPFSNTQRIIISPVRDSGAISLTAAGGFLTSTADFFSATDVGKYLKINNTEFPITSFSNNTVDVATTATTQLGDVISLGATGPSSVLKTGGAVTFSVSNGLLTSSEDFFESTHQGHYFRTDSGDVYNIQSINLAYVNQPTTVAASTGTIRKSSDLSLIRSSVFINVKAENGTLTSSQSFFTEDDVGELFRMDTGEIFHIKSYVNSTSVNITTTAIASPGRIINATTLIEEGDSGSIEVTATNGKLTSDAALFNTTHVGKIFQMDTGEAFYIASYTPVSVNTITTTFESTGKILDPDTYAEIRSSGTTKITASNGTLSSDGVFFTDDDLGRVFRMDNGDMDMFTIKSIPRTRVTTSNTTSAGPATGEIYIKESSSNSGHSGNIRITASGSQLTAESAFFSDEDIGKIFRMDSGEVFNINAFTSSTSVSISETLASAGPSAGALYDFGTPNLLFGDDVQNAVKTDLNIKGFEDKPFLTISFDFNILAEDVAIDVQRTEDSGTTWSTILSIEPPYIGTSGTSSLTGYLGLLDNPYVFAVEGNNTDVQKTYAARVSVRDQIPYDSTSTSQRLKLSVRSLVSKPAELTVLSPSAGFAATSGEAGVLLDWSNNGANPSTGGDYVYLIERKGGTTTDYKILGWSFSPSYYDKSAAELITYTYRVKAVSSGGATAYLPEVTGIW